MARVPRLFAIDIADFDTPNGYVTPLIVTGFRLFVCPVLNRLLALPRPTSSMVPRLMALDTVGRETPKASAASFNEGYEDPLILIGVFIMESLNFLPLLTKKLRGRNG